MMSMKDRYHILPDGGDGSVLVFDSETGAIQHPACWQDLSALYHYMMGRGRMDEAQRLLAESMAGAKPITTMLAFVSRTGTAARSCR